jgi:GDP-L-fucose synthase
VANACFHLMQHYNEKEFVNIGTGEDISIKKIGRNDTVNSRF